MLPKKRKPRHMNICAVIFALVTIVGITVATGRTSTANANAKPPKVLAQVTPMYVTWYYATPTPTPSPITGAYAAIGGALGAGNIYNTATNGFGTNGTGILNTGECLFLCYGSPGVLSANVLAMGNDIVSSSSFTTIGAPDDCTASTPPLCPAGVSDNFFSIEYYASATATPSVFVAIDASGDLAVANGIYAGAAVVAGAGDSTPEPSPSAGSLVSYTGPATGDVLLGSNGAGNYVKCDYGESTPGSLTCSEPFVVSSGGIQPNGSSGGYAPEAFPVGEASPHPRVLTGTCAVTADSTDCTFPNSFHFDGMHYNCTISAQGTSVATDSYVKDSNSKITIYSGTSATFSYTCMG
jgi:hypothetical protein